MALKIIKATEKIEVKRVKVLIYGEPGSGKSSAAFASKNPLMLDFDDGIERVINVRKDAVSVKDHSWSEIKNNLKDVIMPYNTIIADTVGGCLEKVTKYLINRDSKMLNRTGMLTIQGYGALRREFVSWLDILKGWDKDIIFVAHEKENKEGDLIRRQPDITGGSWEQIRRVFDCICHTYMKGRKYYIGFDPTEEYQCKNPAKLKDIDVTGLDSTKPEWFDELVIRKMKKQMGAVSKHHDKVIAEIAAFKKDVSEVSEDNSEQLNTLMLEIKNHDKTIEPTLKRILYDKVKLLNGEYDKSQGMFIFNAEEKQINGAPA